MYTSQGRACKPAVCPELGETMSESLHVVCPHCQTTNRVRADQLVSGPDCGNCKKALFDGQPAALDEAAFDKHIARNQIPVLVDFWAPWCGPCRVVAPVLEDIAEERDDLKIVKLNIDENQQTAATHSILAIPTMVLFRNGQEAKRIQGAMPKKRLEAELEPALA